MDVFEEIDYWINTLQDEIHCYETEEKKEFVKSLFVELVKQNNLFYYFLEEKKGVVVYCFNFDFLGNGSIDELFMYIKPEYRGSIKLFKELVCHLETVARENKCTSVRIGANLKYKDQKILKTLNLLGYKSDVVVKHL